MLCKIIRPPVSNGLFFASFLMPYRNFIPTNSAQLNLSIYPKIMAQHSREHNFKTTPRISTKLHIILLFIGFQSLDTFHQVDIAYLNPGSIFVLILLELWQHVC